MPRNPVNKRVEVLLSPEQHDALIGFVKAEYLGDMSADVSNGHIGAAIRWVLAEMIPSFADAKPLPERGKYDRREKAIRLELGASGYVLDQEQEDEVVAEILATANQYKSLDDAIEAWKEREVRGE